MSGTNYHKTLKTQSLNTFKNAINKNNILTALANIN